jgi:opacity protein-like surface antigen
MKRSLLVIAFASLCMGPAVADAQGLGVIGGLSYGTAPNANGVLPGELKGNSGFAIGLAAETGGVVGFGINGMYAQRGFSSSSPGFSQKYSYIDVPIYLKVSLPNSMITPFGFVGPQGSFEMNCDGGGGSCPSGRSKTTFSGVIGAGLKFGMLGGLSVQGRYVYGLTNLNLSTVSNSGNYQPRSFMILAGIGF